MHEPHSILRGFCLSLEKPMRITLYSLCILALVSCGQKGDLVRPKSDAEKLADALATPSTTQDSIMIDEVATPKTQLEFDEQNIDEVEIILEDSQTAIQTSQFKTTNTLLLAANVDGDPNPCPEPPCSSENSSE